MDLLQKLNATAAKLETAETRMRYAISDAEMVKRMNLVSRLRRELRALEAKRDLVLGR
jgi:lipid II:glycine glycyltransferase (peptidoglycan interpeptide bridge formation enzyme)